MNEDMSEILKNFTKMINGQEIPENMKTILNSINTNNNANTNTSTNTNKNNTNTPPNQNNNSTPENNIFGDFDINTILKIQKIMNSINNDKTEDSRTNLLKSLKPYLKDSRKNKVDQYIQLMKMGKILEIINPIGGDTKNV